MNISDPMPATSRKAIVGPIFISIAFVMELTLVPLLLPAIQAQIGLTIGQLAWVFNSYGIAVAVGVLLGGWFGDALNVKRVFSFGVLLFALGSVLVAMAGSYEAIVLGRAVQGFGGGVFSPLVPLLLTRASPHRPGKVLIVWGSVAGYAAALAPLMYAHFFEGMSWPLAFIGFAVLSIAALTIIPGTEVEDDGMHFLQPTARVFKFLRARDLWFMFGYVFCTYGAITYYLFRMPIWLTDHDWQATSIGLILSLTWLSFSVLSTILRNRVDEPHVRTIMLAAPLLIAAGFPLAYFCEEMICLILSAVLVGSGLACSNAPSTQLILKLAPKGMAAMSASIDITCARLGGVAMVGFFAQSSFGSTIVAALLMSIAAAICAVVATKSLLTGHDGDAAAYNAALYDRSSSEVKNLTNCKPLRR